MHTRPPPARPLLLYLPMRLIGALMMVGGGLMLVAATAAAQSLPCDLNGYELREPVVKLRQLGAPAGNESLRLKAILALPESQHFDPAASGLRLMVLDDSWTSDDLVLDVVAPAGAEWRVNDEGKSWAFRAAAGSASGITRVVVKEIVPNLAYVTPRQYALAIDARRGSYGSTSDLESHFVLLTVAADTPDEWCAVRPFYPWLFTEDAGGEPVEPWEAFEWMPACRFRGDGRTLACTSGPRVGSCRVSLPNDLLLCDVQNAAAAEEQYRATTGSYYDGPCEGLPGFSASPDVTCTAFATPDAFSISTTSPNATLSRCTIDSTGSDSLTCS